MVTSHVGSVPVSHVQVIKVKIQTFYCQKRRQLNGNCEDFYFYSPCEANQHLVIVTYAALPVAQVNLSLPD